MNDTQMTAIYVPVSVTEVRTTAFGQCISLTDVYYGSSETDWAAMTVDDTMDMNAYLQGRIFTIAQQKLKPKLWHCWAM